MNSSNNKNKQYMHANFTYYLYVWLALIIILTFIIFVVGYYNFPNCLFLPITITTPNANYYDIKKLTPAYPPPLVSFI